LKQKIISPKNEEPFKLTEPHYMFCGTLGLRGNKKTKSRNTQTKNKTRKPNHKYTNKKQNNQNLGKQTQPRSVKNGSMYKGVKKSME